MNVPDRLNHRRRVVYAALRKAFDRDQRIPKLFIFWDRTFASLDHFVISPYVEQAAARGWLNDQEKRDLTRALMHFMSHDYHELPLYPDEFVNLKAKPVAPPEPALAQDKPGQEKRAVSVPAVRDSQVVKISAIRQPLPSPTTTLTPEMSSQNVVFREVMAVELRLFKDSGRRGEELKDIVLHVAREMKVQQLEPLLETWSQQGFSLEALPMLAEPSAMRALIQLFYRAACEAVAPVSQPLIEEETFHIDTPEIEVIR